MTTNIVPGVTTSGKLFANRDTVKQNLTEDLNFGRRNIRHYSNSNIADGTTNARTALAAADAEGPVVLPPGTYAIASNITLTNNVLLEPGARLKPANGVTVTLNGGFDASEYQHVFDISDGGSIRCTTGQVLYPDQFGAKRDNATDATAAVNAALASGNANHINVEFLEGTYLCDAVADTSIGNMRVTIKGNNTWLKPYTTNKFALTVTAGAAGSLIGPMVISGITFEGTDKSKHGLQLATYFLAKVEDCHFRNCGIGMLVNGTIDSSFYDLNFFGCYVGAYFTIRSSNQHGLTITDIAGQTVTCDETPSLGQPTEQLINRIDCVQCVVGIVVDQRGSPYAHQQCILINKPHIENCIAGIWVKGNQTNPNENPNQLIVCNNMWPEAIGTGSTLHTGLGGPYGSNVTVDGDTEEFGIMMLWGGQAVIRDCGTGKVVVRNRATLITENCTTDNQFVKDDSASIVSRQGLINGGFLAYLNDYAFHYAANQGLCAGFHCLPFNGVSLEYSESGDLLYSKSQYTGDQTANNFGETFAVVDGVLDRQESVGHILRQGSGIFVNPVVTDQTSFYAMKMAIRAYSPAYTFTASGDTLTVAGHDFVDGQEVRLTTTGTLPTGLAANTSYYVVSAGSGTLKLSATAGGAAITASSSGSGTHTIQQHDFDIFINNLDNGFLYKGWMPITKDWRTYFAVSTAQAFNFTASGATLTIPANSLPNDLAVTLGTTGALPAGLSTGVTYYIINSTSSSVQLSLTVGGAAIVTSDSGTGVHTIIPPTGNNGGILAVSGLANVVRKVVLGPMYIMRVDNDARAMELCRSQAFYVNANQVPTLPGPQEKAEAVASSATPTFDFSDSDGDTKTHTLTSLITPTITMVRPADYALVATQDSTGGREILWPTNMRFRYMPPQPNPTPGSKSLLEWKYDGTHGVADGVQHTDNYVADFDAVGALGTFPAINFAGQGTIMLKVRLATATPASKSRLFQMKGAPSEDSHYPFTNGLIYADWLRTTRVEAITPSASVDRANWHWVIVRTDGTDDWELLQAKVDGTLYSISTAAYESIGTITGSIGGAGCQAEVDRFFIFDSRLIDGDLAAVIESSKSTPNADMPTGLLARYEMNYDRGGRLMQDWSGNGRHITLTDATPGLYTKITDPYIIEDVGSLGAGTEVFNFDNGLGATKKVKATGNIALQFNATIPGRYNVIVEMDGAGGHTITYATTVKGTAPTINTTASEKTLVPLFFDGTTWFHA